MEEYKIMKKYEVQSAKNEGQQNRSETQGRSQSSSHRSQWYQSSHNNKGYHKSSSWSRSSYQNNASRYNKIREEETINDIKEDIVRLEKEIELEIKEIRSIKLGL